MGETKHEAVRASMSSFETGFSDYMIENREGDRQGAPFSVTAIKRGRGHIAPLKGSYEKRTPPSSQP